MAKTLEEYRKKRDFGSTPEPSGEGSEGPAGGEPVFVVQEHDASTRHFDFRLEVDGVLKSWAVPKGPSTDPSVKRLAIPTEDHPMDYADFEGVIPPGYGAGTVIVWDRGTWRNLKEAEDGGEPPPLGEQLAQGHATFWLEGEKIRGGYALQRFSRGDDGEKWLLIKMKDEGADARRNPTSTEPESVLSGRTLEEVEEEEG